MYCMTSCDTTCDLVPSAMAKPDVHDLFVPQWMYHVLPFSVAMKAFSILAK